MPLNKAPIGIILSPSSLKVWRTLFVISLMTRCCCCSSYSCTSYVEIQFSIACLFDRTFRACSFCVCSGLILELYLKENKEIINIQIIKSIKNMKTYIYKITEQVLNRVLNYDLMNPLLIVEHYLFIDGMTFSGHCVLPENRMSPVQNNMGYKRIETRRLCVLSNTKLYHRNLLL